jgi:hypothetical protein
MISKRIDRKPLNDNYGKLAAYARDAGKKESDYAAASEYIEDKVNEGDKVLFSWHRGCVADNYDLAIKEIQATQLMNTRSGKQKTYHLMISFRPEDEDKLTKEAFQDIEEEFAEALGFGEHQRHCGVHKNTAHIHLHVAYNMIHPRKFTRHEPYRDFIIQDNLRRKLEKKYGLDIDNGIGEKDAVKRENTKARVVEAQTGQQSFDSYMREHRDSLLAGLKQCKSWKELHTILAGIGVFIASQNNGCVLKDKHGKHSIKGSALAREFSLPNLEKRFGPFQKCEERLEAEEKERYTAKPLRGSEHERGELYQEYRKGIEKRKEFLDQKFIEHKEQEKAIKKKWERKRLEIKHDMDFSFATKKSLTAKTRAREAEEMQALYEVREKAKKEIRSHVPYMNWLEFLQQKTEQGSELALEILRSKNQDVEASSSPPADDQKNSYWRDKAHWQRKIADIYADSDLSNKNKTLLSAVVKMREIQSGGLPGTDGLTHKIDKSGIIIYTLQDGSRILDNGEKIHFTRNSEVARQVAARYARSRFGPCRIEGNALVREQGYGQGKGR